MLRRRLLRIFLIGAAVAVLAGLALLGLAWTAMGAAPEGARLTRIEKSSQWKDGTFFNKDPRIDGPLVEMTNEWFFGGSEHRWPADPIAPEKLTKSSYDTPPASGLRVTWLGHSTMLLEIGGRRVLIDPVWGQRASPLSFMGPLRFYQPPLPLDQIPDVDAIVISHDHYDHLDYPTVLALSAHDTKWFVPLGIGAHLEYWGVPQENLVELDWWESGKAGDIEITCTPARHFSGRGLSDMNRTLWAGWAIASAEHRVFYSGDTAMFEGFIQIGEKLGPFDLTMIEVGAYDAMWADVHLGPEQAVRAHRLVNGRVMLPVHWGLFDLALHSWTEPIDRVLKAAERECVQVVMPPPGGMVEPTKTSSTVLFAGTKWWPDIPGETFEQAPCPSSGMDELNGDAYAPKGPCRAQTASIER